MKTFFPYRDWCPTCVAGRGRDYPHRRVKEADDARSTLENVVDYLFFRDLE